MAVVISCLGLKRSARAAMLKTLLQFAPSRGSALQLPRQVITNDPAAAQEGI